MEFTVKINTDRMTGTDMAGVVKAITDPDVLDKLARMYSGVGLFTAISGNEHTQEDTLIYILDYMKSGNKCVAPGRICENIAKHPNSTKVVLDMVINIGLPTPVKLAKQHPNYKEN